ncbi:MAG: hypothetical protein R6W88_06950 [Desulfobacterales bacterium]
MKKIKAQLDTLSKSLVTLSKKVEKISDQVDKLLTSKATVPAKKIAAKKVVKKKAEKQISVKKKAADKPATMLDTVLDTIKRSKKGITVAQLKEKTKLDSRQLSNALYKLTKKGDIQTRSRGLYVKK